MQPLESVEFVADDGTVPPADEDMVEFGSRRVPRWVVIVACALAALAVVSVVAGRSQPKQVAVADAPNTLPVTVGQFGAALKFGGGPPDAIDVLIAGDQLFVLRANGINRLALPAARVADSVRLNRHDTATSRLFYDAADNRLWLVEQGVRPAQLLELDAATLRVTRRVSADLTVRGAAAMFGHLYLASADGLSDLAPGARAPIRMAALAGSVTAVAADPARRRILVLDESSPVAVSVMSAGRVTARRIFGHLNRGSIAVVGDDIWVGGSGDYGAVMARLDPMTLAPLQTSPVALEANAVVVSPGARDLWVSASGTGLWCLDARTGSVLVQWPTASVPVASRGGAAYVLTGGSVLPLALNGCAG
jgi:hypothetical protein